MTLRKKWIVLATTATAAAMPGTAAASDFTAVCSGFAICAQVNEQENEAENSLLTQQSNQSIQQIGVENEAEQETEQEQEVTVTVNGKKKNDKPHGK